MYKYRKCIWAWALSFMMITSNITPVWAMEQTDAPVVLSEQTVEDPSFVEQTDLSEEQDEKETVAEGEVTEKQPEAAQEEEIKEGIEEGIEEADPQPDQPSNEEAVTDPEETEDSASVSGNEVDEVVDEKEEAVALPEDVSGNEVVEEEPELETSAYAASPEFSVDEDGVLTVVEGKSFIARTYTIPAAAEEIPKGIFDGSGPAHMVTGLRFEDGSVLTKISAGAFAGSKIKEINSVPAGVETIENGVFKNSDLQKISFEGKITQIGDEAFADASNLLTISVPFATVIGTSAFSGCTNLCSIDIASVEQIGATAFRNCGNLNDNSFTWSGKVDTIGYAAFRGCGFETINLRAVLDSTKTVNMAESVFQDNKQLKKVVFSPAMEQVPGSTFYGCNALTNLDFTDSNIQTIGENAFSGCVKLQELSFPESIVNFSERAFHGCAGITQISIFARNPVIAPEAFPTKEGITLKGFKGPAKDYADTKGYKFESLEKAYLVESKINGLGVSFGKEQNRRNKVTVTITVNPELTLVADTFEVINSTTKTNVEDVVLESCNAEQIVYSFTMPDSNVELLAEVAKTEELLAGKLNLRMNKVEASDPGIPYFSSQKTLQWEEAGARARISVYSDKGNIGPWMLNFTSSNTKVASVDETGLVVAKSAGKCTISATAKSNSEKKVSFTVIVDANQTVTDLKLDFDGEISDKITFKDIRVYNSDKKMYETIEKVPVITYSKKSVAMASDTFTMEITPVTESGKKVYIETKWKTGASDIAMPLSETVSTNKNTIKVRRKAEGETILSVSCKNAEDDSKIEKYFIVKVVDITPRLLDDKVSVNVVSTAGTPLDLAEVYGYSIAEAQLYQKSVVNNITETEIYEGADLILDDEGRYCIVADNDILKLTEKNTISLKDSNGLLLKGKLTNGSVTESFQLEIPEVVFKNELPSVSVKLSGKINTFYSEVEKQGTVKATIDLGKDSKEQVDKLVLVSAANYKKANSEVPDSFQENFVIDNDGTIQRNPSSDPEKELVKKGYLYVYLKGYTEPVKKSISISTTNTKQSCVLSKTSDTVHKWNNSAEIKIYLNDKKTKEHLDLTGAKISFNDIKTTSNVFDAEDEFLPIETDEEGDTYFLLKVHTMPSKSAKAVFNIKLSEWSDYQEYSFTLKVDSSMPKVSLKSSQIVLNNQCVGEIGENQVSVNRNTVALDSFGSFVYTSKKYVDEAEKIKLYYDQSEGVIKAYLTEAVRKGSYTFQVVPYVLFNDDEEAEAVSPIKVKVNVIDSLPSVSLKKSSFTLNALYTGTEEVSTTFTLKDLTGEGELDDSAMTLSAVKVADQAIVDKIKADIEDGELKLQLTGRFYKDFSVKCILDGLKVQTESGQSYTVKPVTISVKGKYKEPTVTLKQSGSLDLVNLDSNISYTLSVKDINGKLATDSVILEEFDERGSLIRDPENMRFDIQQTDNKIILKVKDPEQNSLRTDKKYQIRFKYKLDATGSKLYESKFLTVQPKQKLPSMKFKADKSVLYAGSNNNQITVTMTNTSKTNAEVESVALHSDVDRKLKNAFKINYPPESEEFQYTPGSDEFQIVLDNPAWITLNTSYELLMEVRYKGQAENTSGTKVKVKVTVKK